MIAHETRQSDERSFELWKKFIATVTILNQVFRDYSTRRLKLTVRNHSG
jgi:hypothetical protein